MIHWKDVDPDRYERAVQALLKRQHPGLKSLDGSGGDGGRDAQLVTEDGTWVFEMKAFARRLTSGQRAQIVSSLKTAVTTVPGMTKWTLVIPKSMTPRMPPRKGRERYSDEKWFEDELSKHAPGVELEWKGRDWLDVQAGENPDFQRYVEGPHAQLLQRAKEYRMEAEALTHGGADLFRRNETLRKRADELSMHWRLSYLVTRDTQVFTLEEKYPGAAKDDPITLRPTFSFDIADEDGTAMEVRSQLERTLSFGGRVVVPSRFVSSFEVEASEEARLLLGAGEDETASLYIESTQTAIEPPLAGRLALLEPDDTDCAAMEVYFRERTAGSRGVTLLGGDAAGLLSVEAILPIAPDDHVSGTPLPESAVSFETSDVEGRPLDSVAQLADVLAATTERRRICLDIGYGRTLIGEPLSEPKFLGADRLRQVAQALLRLQRHVGKRLWYPRGMTVDQADMLIVAARLLDGEQVPIPADEWTVRIVPHGVDSVLKIMKPERFQLLCTRPETVLVAGDLEIPYGPMTQWGPELSLINREELSKHDGVSPMTARLATNGRPVSWLPFEKAKEIAEARVPTP